MKSTEYPFTEKLTFKDIRRITELSYTPDWPPGKYWMEFEDHEGRLMSVRLEKEEFIRAVGQAAEST